MFTVYFYSYSVHFNQILIIIIEKLSENGTIFLNYKSECQQVHVCGLCVT